MNPSEFLEYLWARPQTHALAQSLAMVYVEHGRFDLVSLLVTTAQPTRVARQFDPLPDPGDVSSSRGRGKGPANPHQNTVSAA